MSVTTKSLFVLIPVFNEEKNIKRLLADLNEFQNSFSSLFSLKAVFIDDGSTDNSSKLLEETKTPFDKRVIKLESNCGPGTAFANGFSYLYENVGSDDWVVTMEGDNTSRIDTLKHMLVRKEEGYQVVLASPYTYGGGFEDVPFIRMMLSHIANGMIKFFLGLRGINTFSSFFRLYKGNVIIELQRLYGEKIIFSKGFECMVEMLVKLVWLKASISEVEMKVDWGNRKGFSKMKTGKTILGYIKLIYKLGKSKP